MPIRVFYPCMVCGLEFETQAALQAHTCRSDSDATDSAA